MFEPTTTTMLTVQSIKKDMVKYKLRRLKVFIFMIFFFITATIHFPEVAFNCYSTHGNLPADWWDLCSSRRRQLGASPGSMTQAHQRRA